MPDRRLILIGEDPGRGDPRCPVYPWPAGCTGARLCDLLGMNPAEYVNDTLRVNIFYEKPERWNAKEAHARVLAMGGLLDGAAVIACGRRVAKALGLPEASPWYSGRRVKLGVARAIIVPIPHPSGRNRAWSDPAETERARVALDLTRRAVQSPDWRRSGAEYLTLAATTLPLLHQEVTSRAPIEPPRIDERGFWTVRVRVPARPRPCLRCDVREQERTLASGLCVTCLGARL